MTAVSDAATQTVHEMAVYLDEAGEEQMHNSAIRPLHVIEFLAHPSVNLDTIIENSENQQ
jgi:hypothetical protein